MKHYPLKYFFGDTGCPDGTKSFTVRLPAPATSLQFLPEIAAQRSLSQPGELIYIWRDTDEVYLNEPVTYRFLLADTEELQINNVLDRQIVSVWLDGEEISE